MRSASVGECVITSSCPDRAFVTFRIRMPSRVGCIVLVRVCRIKSKVAVSSEEVIIRATSGLRRCREWFPQTFLSWGGHGHGLGYGLYVVVVVVEEDVQGANQAKNHEQSEVSVAGMAGNCQD